MTVQEYYTPDEVSQKLKIDVRTLYRWIREGKIRAVKIGHFWRISQAALDEFLQNPKGE
jgi:excisionase family DNA binding protein